MGQKDIRTLWKDLYKYLVEKLIQEKHPTRQYVEKQKRKWDSTPHQYTL